MLKLYLSPCVAICCCRCCFAERVPARLVGARGVPCCCGRCCRFSLFPLYHIPVDFLRCCRVASSSVSSLGSGLTFFFTSVPLVCVLFPICVRAATRATSSRCTARVPWWCWHWLSGWWWCWIGQSNNSGEMFRGYRHHTRGGKRGSGPRHRHHQHRARTGGHGTGDPQMILYKEGRKAGKAESPREVIGCERFSM